MAELSERWPEIGEQLAEWADCVAPAGTLARARARLMAPRMVPWRRSRLPRALALAAVVVGLVAVVLWFGRRAEALSFAVGSPPAPGRVGDWVAAGAEPLGVRFTDGSRVEVAQGARMRVTATSANGAVVLIERGRVRADIHHGSADTDWRLRAGPFVVRVTGTELLASWDPEAEIFELGMVRGSVEVSGPWLPPGRRVVGGEQLHVAVRQGRMRLSSLAEAEASAAASRRAPPTAAPSVPAAGAGSRPPAASASVAARKPSGWRARAARHDYRGAMASLDAPAFEALIGGSDAAGLRALADAARFGGRPDRARRALAAARRRFGASGATTFLLGKIAADQLRSPGEAIQWFETYLRERPRGPLAEQALGRILELQQHGASGAAAARRYLARFPEGAYAALARRVLDRSSR